MSERSRRADPWLPDDAECQRLFAGLLDEALDDDELVRLGQILEDRPDAAASLTAMFEIDGLLRCLGATEHAEADGGADLFARQVRARLDEDPELSAKVVARWEAKTRGSGSTRPARPARPVRSGGIRGRTARRGGGVPGGLAAAIAAAAIVGSILTLLALRSDDVPETARVEPTPVEPTPIERPPAPGSVPTPPEPTRDPKTPDPETPDPHATTPDPATPERPTDGEPDAPDPTPDSTPDPTPDSTPDPTPPEPPPTERPTGTVDAPSTIARIRVSAGDLVASRGGAKTTVGGDAERELAAGDEIIMTSIASRALLSYPSGSTFALAGPETTVRLGAPGEPVHLARGRLAATIARPTRRDALKVETPEATIAGAMYHVRTADGTSRVDVTDGTARVVRSRDGKSVRVKAGHFVVVGPDDDKLVAFAGRADDALLVRYRFDEGSGSVARDDSGRGDPLDVHFPADAPVRWVRGGVVLERPTRGESRDPATKIIRAIGQTEEATLEAWLAPADARQQGPARIVTVSGGTDGQNLTLGHGQNNDPLALYVGRFRTSRTDPAGRPTVKTPDGTVTTELTHLVYTRRRDGTATIWVNGREVASGPVPGDTSVWTPGFRLAIGNEFDTLDRGWLGTLRLIAIHGAALGPREIARNFRAGPD